MPTKELSTEQLHEYFLEHVRYEMQHLINAAVAIDQQLKVPMGLQYMAVESFVIHLRNLITFLYPYNQRPNDVCAQDFFKNQAAWESIRPSLSESLKEAKIRADVEVGHLTTFRKNGTPENKDWNVKGLTGEVVPLMKLFCESADKVNLVTDIQPLLSQHAYLQS